MKRAIYSIAIILLACLGASHSFSTELQWVGPSFDSIGSAASASGALSDCVLGNEESDPQFVENVVQSDFEFAYLLDPADFNCCADGFQPESITFYLNAGAEDVMSKFVYVAVYSAEGGPGTWTPGVEICVSPMGWILNVDLPGLYSVTIPPYPTGSGDLVCPCLDNGSPYFIVGHINGTIEPGAEPDAVIDRQPEGGRSYVRQGSGVWQDVVTDLGWQGELVQHASVTCCGEPLSTEESTWGKLKSLYR